jgi:hypothetical protein
MVNPGLQPVISAPATDCLAFLPGGPIFLSISVVALDKMASWTTHERHYCRSVDHFLKRTLSPSEYRLDYRGQVHIPFDNVARLKNEAAALEFIKRMTDIPVPRVLEASEHSDGSFHLATELVPGIPMKELAPADQTKVMEEIEKHLKTLRGLRSTQIGGPSGIVCPPPVATQLEGGRVWKSRPSSTTEYVFCHNDLSQSNVIVDPVTLGINGIIDWEFAGFFPECFDIPFYRSPLPSGAQIRALANTPELEEILSVRGQHNNSLSFFFFFVSSSSNLHTRLEQLLMLLEARNKRDGFGIVFSVL